jgi:signal transduction histidine kinase
VNYPSRTGIKTGSGADLAFAVVVLSSFFATFSSLQTATPLIISVMLGLGTAYIAIGIYGYGICSRSNNLYLKMAYFIIQTFLGGTIIHIGQGNGLNAMVLLPLAGHSVVLLPQRWVYPANLAIIAAYVAATFVPGNLLSIWSGLPIFLAGQIFIIIFTQMAVGEARSRQEVERLVNELGEANQRLRELNVQAEELATQRERNRLAREIHDGLGHYLTTIHIQIQAARALVPRDPARAMESLNSAQNLTQEALADVRRSVASLRAPEGENLPLTEEIARMLKNSEAGGIQTELRIVGSPRALPPAAQLTVIRAVQEGINNTCKHAHASQMWVTLDYTHAKEVLLRMRDDGVGSSAPEGGFGLISLRERALLINGSFQTQTAPGAGFTLELVVPG